MSRLKKNLVSSLLVLGGGVLATFVLLFVEERHADARLSKVVQRLDARTETEDPARIEALHSRLVGMDTYLDQRAPWKDVLGAPGMWVPERRLELEQGLASLGTFFEQVDSLLADPVCRSVLDRDHIAAVDAPRLGLSRHRTRVLCAKALVEFDRPDGVRAAGRRLGQALDFIRLGDDGKLFGYLLSTAEEDIVLEALQRLLQRADADVVPLREELDGRLERIARGGRAETALARDLAEFRARRRPPAERGWMPYVPGLGDLMESERLADCWEESLRLVRMPVAESRDRLDAFVEAHDGAHGRFMLDVANDSHVYRARVELALAALDLAQQLRSRVARSTPLWQRPSDPFRLVEAEDHVELRAESTLAALQVKPGDPRSYLLCWTIPR